MTDWNHSTPLVSATSYSQAMIPLRVEGADPTNPALDSFEQVALSTVVAGVPRDSSLISFTPSGAGAVARTVQAKLRETISVTDFGGCDPTGATPSDAAFQAAFAKATSTRLTQSYGDPLMSVVIHVPSGQYLLTQSESIIPSSYTSKTTGFVLVGDDMAQTQIIFAPTAGSNILVYNQAFLFSRFEDITFVGTSLAQTFYRADMTVNNQQGLTFNRCMWTGIWGKGFYLTGVNNNSEYVWNQCRGGGQMFQFLYTPPVGGGSSGSDQFLNYTFNDCFMWFGAVLSGTAGTFTGSIAGDVLTVTGSVTGALAAGHTVATPAASSQQFCNRIAGQPDRVVILSQLTGAAGGVGTYQVINCTGSVSSGTLANLVNDANSMIDMASGGHVRIRGCDFSGWNSGTLYQLYGSSHSTGVCVFSAVANRYELHSPAVAVIYCEWPAGTVTFDHEDWSSQAYAGGPYVTSSGGMPIAYYFSFASVEGPDISFSRSQLAGLISLAHGTNDFECEKAVRFDRCTHVNLFDIYQMAVFPTGVNEFGSTPISIEFCRGAANRMSGYTPWAANTIYAAGAQVSSNSGASIYSCTTGGTSGSASASITGSISGNSLTVSAVASGTIAVGQKLIGQKNAVVIAGTTSGSTTVTVTSRSSGMLAIGQAIIGTNIPAGATIASLGTFNGTSGSITISAVATGPSSGLTLNAYGACILEDTIITAGSGSSWTINRSQAAASQAIVLQGGPQSAASSIPDGTAVWSYTANNTRNYFFDGNMISPNFAGGGFTGVPINLKSRKRIAEFGGQFPTNTSGNYGANEIIIPPNAIITGAFSYAPAGAVTSGYAADYLIELDDGTKLLSILPQTACASGWSVAASNVLVPVSASMQKRKIRLIAGGAGGGTIDQPNAAARAWVEYVL